MSRCPVWSGTTTTVLPSKPASWRTPCGCRCTRWISTMCSPGWPTPDRRRPTSPPASALPSAPSASIWRSAASPSRCARPGARGRSTPRPRRPSPCTPIRRCRRRRWPASASRCRRGKCGTSLPAAASAWTSRTRSPSSARLHTSPPVAPSSMTCSRMSATSPTCRWPANWRAIVCWPSARCCAPAAGAGR